MRNLLDFLIKYFSWLLFAGYVTISCILLLERNPFQHHIFMSSAGRLAASVYEVSSEVTSYFNLRDINEDLQVRNAALESDLIAAREQIKRYEELYYADSMKVIEPLRQFDFIIARVINNSVHKPFNYITLNKGAADGIKPEMGIVDQNGVVGIVNLVGEHNSRAISILNPYLRLSCKVKGNDAFGSLVWDGKNYDEAVLEELPRHTVYNAGDTVITSGYSAVFPEGIPVGTIIGTERTIDDNFYSLRVKLSTDFTTLSTVRVVENSMIDEIRNLEKEPETDKEGKKK